MLVPGHGPAANPSDFDIGLSLLAYELVNVIGDAIQAPTRASLLAHYERALFLTQIDASTLDEAIEVAKSYGLVSESPHGILLLSQSGKEASVRNVFFAWSGR